MAGASNLVKLVVNLPCLGEGLHNIAVIYTCRFHIPRLNSDWNSCFCPQRTQYNHYLHSLGSQIIWRRFTVENVHQWHHSCEGLMYCRVLFGVREWSGPVCLHKAEITSLALLPSPTSQLSPHQPPCPEDSQAVRGDLYGIWEVTEVSSKLQASRS